MAKPESNSKICIYIYFLRSRLLSDVDRSRHDFAGHAGVPELKGLGFDFAAPLGTRTEVGKWLLNFQSSELSILTTVFGQSALGGVGRVEP